MMKNKYFLKCAKCSEVYSEISEELAKCPKCEDGPLSIVMNEEKLKEKWSKNEFFKLKISSMWTFFDFLPLKNKNNIISLKEGNTPLLKEKRLAKKLELSNLFLKQEFLNPTGSFKDRQISMGISKAVEMNKKSVITMSSGNVGAAVAAYSARAGLPNIILIPSIAPEAKIIQIKMYGGNVIKIKSDSTKFISEIVEKAKKEFNMANLITASVYNPFIINGAKTIAYELAIQFINEENALPDAIIIPVGGSGLLSAVFEGFKELKTIGFIDKIPKLFAIQPEGCAPFVQAIQNNLSPSYLFEHPWKEIKTISTALADDIPLDCYLGIPAIKNSKGTAIAVSDQETLVASQMLSSLEGIWAEPSSCTTIAALKPLLDMNLIEPDERITCLITGSGFKDIQSIQPLLKESQEVAPDFDWKSTFKNLLPI
ncbi:MAG: threonine synthase [Promethearchaeota archaeon]